MSSAISVSQKLLAAAHIGNQGAQNEIILMLTPLLRKISSRYFIIGADNEDLLQEARIGLHNAIKSYDAAKNSDFLAYAKICIHNHIISAIKEAQCKKHAALNKSVDLDSAPLFSYDSPMELVIQREELESVLAMAEDKLSKLEKQVLFLYLDGRSYKEIATLLHISAKSVSNALCRIRSKLS
ncbi:MAG: sigma-70 family RNA polymerase sigma factor [Clostridia bacterium]|nr:sigma-70 family RNA polymerase sigma factor [Clostridia bacterium]